MRNNITFNNKIKYMQLSDKYRISKLNKAWALEQYIKQVEHDNLLNNGTYHNKPKYYNKKVVICGKSVQIYDFDKALRVNYNMKNRLNYEKNHDKVLNDYLVEKAIHRTRNNIKNLIDCNVNEFSKFITLTYSKTALDRNQVINDLNLFTKRFKYWFGEKLEYVGVLEHQKERGEKEGNEGSYHFHLVVFNRLKLDLKLLTDKVWGYGITNTKKIDSIENIGRYLMKYITKEVYMNNNLFNKKSLFNSQGLKRPKVEYIYGHNYTSNLIESLEVVKYEKEYQISFINEQTGEVFENKGHLREYNLDTIKILS